MRKTVNIVRYRLVPQFKLVGGNTPEEAAMLANEWCTQGYEVDISVEDRGSNDEAIAVPLTYLVEARRTVVEVDEYAVAEAVAEIQEEANVKRARKKKK